MTTELKELFEDVKMITEETIDDEWEVACQNYPYFSYKEEYEPCGDTYVSTGRYMTEESETAFREEFKRENKIDDFIDKLKTNPDFRKCIENLVKEYADTKEIYT